MKTVPISDIIVRDDVCRDTNRNWDFVWGYARDIILWKYFGGSPPAVEINQRGEYQRRIVEHLLHDAGVQVPEIWENALENRAVRPIVKNLSWVRIHQSGSETLGSRMDVSRLRYSPRPRHQRGDQYQEVRPARAESCRGIRRGTHRRACGLASVGKGDEAGSPALQGVVVHRDCADEGAPEGD